MWTRLGAAVYRAVLIWFGESFPDMKEPVEREVMRAWQGRIMQQTEKAA
jgi:hypothetical protein